MRKVSKRLVAFATIVCVITSTAIPISVAADTDSLNISNVIYNLEAKKVSSSTASYCQVAFSIKQENNVIADSMTAAPIWHQAGTSSFFQGTIASGTNVSGISGADFVSSVEYVSSCFVTFIIYKNGTTYQRSVTAF